MRGNLTLSWEKKLIKNLLDTYHQAGIIGRPVIRTEEAITVQFGMALIQILNLDEQNQILTVSTWNRYLWQDDLLTWDSSEYGGIENIRVPASKVWLPDIVLYNYADDRLSERREAMVTVAKDGLVSWIPPAIYKSSCSIDISRFPFDSQRCKFKFGSWSYDGTKVDIMFLNNMTQIDLGDFVASNEWDIISYDAVRTVTRYPCCVEPYPDLTYTLELRRKVAFYSYILLLPCILLSVLVMILFWIPPESAAKMQLGINIFVAFFVLLLLLANNTPSGASSVPLIGVYYCLNMVLVTFSTFLAMFVVRTYVRFDRKNGPPRWLTSFVLGFLARLLLMKSYIPGHIRKQYKSDAGTNRRAPKSENGVDKTAAASAAASSLLGSGPRRGGVEEAAASAADGSAGEQERLPTPDMSPIHLKHSIQRDVRDIRNLIRGMQTKLQAKDALNVVVSEWRAIAMVMDRVFFIVYVLVVVASVATIFPQMA